MSYDVRGWKMSRDNTWQSAYRASASLMRGLRDALGPMSLGCVTQAANDATVLRIWGPLLYRWMPACTDTFLTPSGTQRACSGLCRPAMVLSTCSSLHWNPPGPLPALRFKQATMSTADSRVWCGRDIHYLTARFRQGATVNGALD